MFQEFKKSFSPNVKNDTLSGLTVALALVPEAVAFAFVAGVHPLIGLHAAFHDWPDYCHSWVAVRG